MTTKGKEYAKVPTTCGVADFPVSNEKEQEACAERRRSSARLRKREEPLIRCSSTSSVASTVDMSVGGEGTDSSVGYATNISGNRSKKKKRKKTPPSAEECAGLAQAKKRQTEDLSCGRDRVAETTVGKDEETEVEAPLPRRKKDSLPSEEEIARDVRYKPTADIGGKILDSVETIERVASVSKNLKGGFIRDLKLAARTTRVAVAEMAKRTTATGDAQELEEANLRLRAEVHGLREEVSALRAEIQCLRRRSGHAKQPANDGRSPPPHPPIPQGSLEDLPPPLPSPGVLTPSERLLAATRTVLEADVDRCPGAVPGTSFDPEGDTLMGRIGALIEKKLGEFRDELFPGRAIRPSLGRKPEGPDQGGEKGRDKEKKDREGEERRKKGKETDGIVNGRKGVGDKRNLAPAPVSSQDQDQGQGQGLGQVQGQGQGRGQGQGKELWSEVVGRKAKKKAVGRGGNRGQPPPPPPQPTPSTTKKQRRKAAEEKKGKVMPGRPPKIAAVTLTIAEGSRVTYSEAMLKARESIKLSDLGIAEVKPKRAITGGLILEVPGEESAAKADALASRMQAIFAGTEIRVARPMKRTELRVTGLVDSVTVKEVVAAVARHGGCQEGDVHSGDIRMSPSGLGSLWLRCPTAAARKLVEAGRLMVGWSYVRVEALAARPLQCYRCLEKGHVRQRCTSGVDRSRRCYVCGEVGHKASACAASAPRCPLCVDLGRPAAHRLGGAACKPPSSKRKGGKKGPPREEREKENPTARLEKIRAAQVQAEGMRTEEAATPGTNMVPTVAAAEVERMGGKPTEERMEVEGDQTQEKRGLEGVMEINE